MICVVLQLLGDPDLNFRLNGHVNSLLDNLASALLINPTISSFIETLLSYMILWLLDLRSLW
jgi:hypothetical protein